MTSRRRVRARRAAALSSSRRRSRSLPLILAGLGVMLAVGSIALVVATRGGESSHNSTTGSPSGGSVQATGVARAGGIEVEAARIDLGQVPLDTTVTPTWHLRNAGPTSVVLADPHVEVIDGCCPGRPVFAASELAPGEETTLTFPLVMHEGMDGPHDFRLHVSVGGEVLELQVTANFG